MDTDKHSIKTLFVAGEVRQLSYTGELLVSSARSNRLAIYVRISAIFWLGELGLGKYFPEIVAVSASDMDTLTPLH